MRKLVDLINEHLEVIYESAPYNCSAWNLYCAWDGDTWAPENQRFSKLDFKRDFKGFTDDDWKWFKEHMYALPPAPVRGNSKSLIVWFDYFDMDLKWLLGKLKHAGVNVNDVDSASNDDIKKAIGFELDPDTIKHFSKVNYSLDDIFVRDWDWNNCGKLSGKFKSALCYWIDDPKLEGFATPLILFFDVPASDPHVRNIAKNIK